MKSRADEYTPQGGVELGALLFDIDPATGVELDALAKEVMTATPDIVEKVKKLIGK
jgi:hypothetical protein